MRNRIFVVLAIAVLAGGGLAYGTYNMVNNQPVKTVSTPTQPVVVAASNLQLGAQLKAEDLKVIAFPQGQAPEGTFAQPSEIIGRGLIVPIVKNEPVLKAKLASKEAGSGLPPVIPEGMRAVSVRVDEVVGVAGYVLPGNRVDVLATANPTDAARRHDDEGDSVERAGADRRHAHGAGPGEEEAGGRHRRDAARLPGAVRAPRAGEHGRQDSARAAQPARPGCTRNAWHQDRRIDGAGDRAPAEGGFDTASRARPCP